MPLLLDGHDEADVRYQAHPDSKQSYGTLHPNDRENGVISIHVDDVEAELSTLLRRFKLF